MLLRSTKPPPRVGVVRPAFWLCACLLLVLYWVGKELHTRVEAYANETSASLKTLVKLGTIKTGVEDAVSELQIGSLNGDSSYIPDLLDLYESIDNRSLGMQEVDQAALLVALQERLPVLERATAQLQRGQVLRAREAVQSPRHRAANQRLSELLKQAVDMQQRRVMHLQQREEENVAKLEGLFTLVLLSCMVLVGIVSLLDGRNLRERFRENRLVERKRVLEMMASSSNTLVYLYNLDEKRNLFINDAITPLLGWTSQQASSLGPRLMDKLIHPEDADNLAESKSGQKLSPNEAVVSEFRLLHANGSYRWFSARETAFDTDRSGRAVTVLGSAIDITEQKEQEIQIAVALEKTRQQNEALREHERRFREEKDLLTRAANTDALTGLENQRALKNQLELEFEVHKAAGKPLCLIMLDLDDFKEINDQHGHPAGDEVLRIVGSILKDGVRAGDCAARYGGEEFAVLCPVTSLEHSLTLAERLRRNIHAHRVHGRHLSASFGVAEVDDSTEKPSDLIEHADRSLYEAKRLGKNQIVSYDSSMADPMRDARPPYNPAEAWSWRE